MTISFGQNDLQLLPEGAAFDASRGLLFVSDLHLGKTAVFRDAGLALPEGPDDRILTRLTDLIAQTAAKSLVVLGDVSQFAHAVSHAIVRYQQFSEARAYLEVLGKTMA